MKTVYNNLLIIYYSGTGNSARVSEWIAENARSKGMNVHVASFNKFNPADIAHFEGKTLIGFYSATHGFNMPHSMIAFMLRFKELRGSDTFIGNTRAGMKLWKLFMPGLSGIAMYFPALIMLLKGYKVKAMYPVDLPSNWISLHPGLRQKIVDSMVVHCNTLVNHFADRVLIGRRVYLRSLVLLPLDALVAPIAIGYYFIGRFMLAKTFVASDKCNACGLCARQCPTKSIIIKDNRPYWKFSCESCMHCMNYCPERAVETAHTLIFTILAVFILVLNPLFARWAHALILSGQFSNQLRELVYFILQWSMMMLAFWAGYEGLYFLMKFPTLNRFISFFSVTRFAFWRRYHIPGKQSSR